MPEPPNALVDPPKGLLGFDEPAVLLMPLLPEEVRELGKA